MTFVHVPTPEGFEMEEESVEKNFFWLCFRNEINIALRDVRKSYLMDSFF
jgi:hypothetical protein